MFVSKLDTYCCESGVHPVLTMYSTHGNICEIGCRNSRMRDLKISFSLTVNSINLKFDFEFGEPALGNLKEEITN